MFRGAMGYGCKMRALGPKKKKNMMQMQQRSKKKKNIFYLLLAVGKRENEENPEWQRIEVGGGVGK